MVISKLAPTTILCLAMLVVGCPGGGGGSDSGYDGSSSATPSSTPTAPLTNLPIGGDNITFDHTCGTTACDDLPDVVGQNIGTITVANSTEMSASVAVAADSSAITLVQGANTGQSISTTVPAGGTVTITVLFNCSVNGTTVSAAITTMVSTEGESNSKVTMVSGNVTACGG